MSVSTSLPTYPPPLPLTLAAFRETFGTAFQDRNRYTDANVTLYLTIAANVLPVDRWGDWYAAGLGWFTAHFVVLDARADEYAAKGQLPGFMVGILTSKSVGGASAGYDVSSGMEMDAGHWNLTDWGRRFLRTARMVGTGPIQVNGSCFGAPGSVTSEIEGGIGFPGTGGPWQT